MTMGSDVAEPLNLGSDELVTINQLVDIVEDIAGIKLGKGSALDIRFSRRLKPQCNENKILVTLRITV